MKENAYDSVIKDTMPHKINVLKVMGVAIEELTERAKKHDNSKMVSPEVEMYDKYIPMLHETEYGTDEYYAIKDKMREEGLNHHYEVNDHHPEHFKNGIADMNLIQMLEMICDWTAASMLSDTPIREGIKKNQNTNNFSDDLFEILARTSENIIYNLGDS
jgi:hypothetical protein